ncbi:UNVERIFIED_CONTAM: hypothetical protein K2H54_006509 [Gekko kuhli]
MWRFPFRKGRLLYTLRGTQLQGQNFLKQPVRQPGCGAGVKLWKGVYNAPPPPGRLKSYLRVLQRRTEILLTHTDRRQLHWARLAQEKGTRLATPATPLCICQAFPEQRKCQS